MSERREVFPVSAQVIIRLRALRMEAHISARVLADRMTALGYPISRSVLANTESGRLPTVSVDFLDTASRALSTDALTVLGALNRCLRCQGEPPSGFTCNACGVAR